MCSEKVYRMKTLPSEKCTTKQEKSSPQKFQYVSVIMKAPPRTFSTSPTEEDDDEIMIVAEYDKKVDIPPKSEIFKDLASEVDKKKKTKRKRGRKKKENNNESSNGSFCYVSTNPEVIDLNDSSDTDSDGIKSTDALDSKKAKKAEMNKEQLEDRPQLSSRFEVLEETSYLVPGEKIWKQEMGVRISKPFGPIRCDDWWEKGFKGLFGHLTSSCDSTDNAAITFTVTNSAHTPVVLSCRPLRDFIYEDLSNLVGSVNGGSSAAFKMDDTFLITICIFRGAMSRELMNMRRELVVNKSILTIRHDDQMSLPRSLAVARVYAERGDARSGELHIRWDRIRCATRHDQLKEARDLVDKSNVKIPKNGWSIRDVEKFQNYLSLDGIAILVYEVFTLGRGGRPLYNGLNVVKNAIGCVRHIVYLAYYERSRHYQPILNIPSAAGGRGFCAPCNTRFNNYMDHNCSNRCTQCFRSPPCDIEVNEKLQCHVCNRCFFGISCYDYHKIERSRLRSICATIQLCGQCWGVIKIGDKKKHVCVTTKELE